MKFKLVENLNTDNFKILDDGKVQLINNNLSDDDWKLIAKHFVRLGYTDLDSALCKQIYSSKIPHTFNDEQSNELKVLLGINNRAEKEYDGSLEKKAKKVLGTTNKFTEAGYLLKDGTMLDFSGKKSGGPSNTRTMDHREINQVYDTILDTNSQYMSDFMSRGNIRLLYPTGIDIHLTQEPTAAQYRTLNSFITSALIKDGEFNLDISNDKGITVASRYYEDKNANVTKIISDIKYYFKNFELPYMSEVNAFREGYNMKFKLVEEQIEYNANPQGKNEGDCTIRALSLAYDMNYNSVKSELNSLARRNESKFNTIDTINAFIDHHGFVKYINNESMSGAAIDDVEDFARKNKHGVYVIYCTNKIKQDTSDSFHLVAVINGKIYDTWDPSEYYVVGAWYIKAHNRTVNKLGK